MVYPKYSNHKEIGYLLINRNENENCQKFFICHLTKQSK